MTQNSEILKRENWTNDTVKELRVSVLNPNFFFSISILYMYAVDFAFIHGELYTKSQFRISKRSF